MVSSYELQQAFKRAVNKAKFAVRYPARLGVPTGPAAWTFTVPGGHGFTYIRVYQGGGVTIAKAIDRIGVTSGTPTGDTPIWVDKDKDGNWIIVELRYEGS